MINTAYLKKCREKKHFMAFTTLVILSGVADKFNKEIDTDNYVILKNRTVNIYENIVAFICQKSLMFIQCNHLYHCFIVYS